LRGKPTALTRQLEEEDVEINDFLIPALNATKTAKVGSPVYQTVQGPKNNRNGSFERRTLVGDEKTY